MNVEVQERGEALSDTATGANSSNSAALETVVEVGTAAVAQVLEESGLSAHAGPKDTVSEPKKEACIAVNANCGGGSKTGNWDGKEMCRICFLSSDHRRSDGLDLMQLGCGCKDELGIAHRHCAEKWFKLKGNRCCEICGKPAKNICGVGDRQFLEEWNTRRPQLDPSIPSERGRCWQSQPCCNFLLSCLVVAFILPWFFRMNIF